MEKNLLSSVSETFYWKVAKQVLKYQAYFSFS